MSIDCIVAMVKPIVITPGSVLCVNACHDLVDISGGD